MVLDIFKLLVFYLGERFICCAYKILCRGIVISLLGLALYFSLKLWSLAIYLSIQRKPRSAQKKTNQDIPRINTRGSKWHSLWLNLNQESYVYNVSLEVVTVLVS